MPTATATAQEHSCHGYDTAKTAHTRCGNVEIQGGTKRWTVFNILSDVMRNLKQTVGLASSVIVY